MRDMTRMESLAAFFELLGDCNEAGIGLERALHSAADFHGESNLGEAIRGALATMRMGSYLADALAAQGDAFPPLYIHAIHDADDTGRLSDCLRPLAIHARRALRLCGSDKPDDPGFRSSAMRRFFEECEALEPLLASKTDIVLHAAAETGSPQTSMDARRCNVLLERGFPLSRALGDAMGLDKTAVMLAAAMEDVGESPWGVLARHHKRLSAREMGLLAELDSATGMGGSESRAPRRL